MGSEEENVEVAEECDKWLVCQKLNQICKTSQLVSIGLTGYRLVRFNLRVKVATVCKFQCYGVIEV